MKKILLFISLLLGFAGSSYADDSFSVDNITLPQNGEADVVVRFSLDAGSTCSGYYFWLQLPEELAFVTYEKNGNTYITYTAGDSYDNTPSITTNLHEGYLKVGFFDGNGDPLNKQSGTLVTFKVKVIGAVNVNDTFEGSLIEGSISSSGGSAHSVASSKFTITIAEPVDLRTVLDETSTVAPAAATGVDVRVKRTIKANEWSTICLPFAMTEAQCKAAFGNDVKIADFTGCEPQTEGDDVVAITANFTMVTAIEANHPYVILVSENVTDFTVDNVNIEGNEDDACVEFDNGKSGSRRVVYSGFYGTYHAGTEVPEFCLFLNGNQFWYSIGATKMKAFRAYFEFLDVLTEVEEQYGSGSRIFMNFVDNEATGIRNIKSSEDGKYFDLLGRGVKPTKKGLYIKDGKKVVIK
ncbi:MAG: hypothetical protein IKN02_06165 [Prevotella sp.]|nr:hypothetical protein [Prevotella sp.]